MANIPEIFNFGESKEMTMEVLLERLARMYIDIATAVNQKPDLYQRTTNGLVTDVALSQGSLNINLLTNKVEILTNHPTIGTVTWTTLS